MHHLALLLALFLTTTDDGPRISPAVTKSGVTCRVQSISASTTIPLDTSARPTSNIFVTLAFAGSGAFVPGEPILSEALDQSEHDILSPRPKTELNPEVLRTVLQNSFRGLAASSPSPTTQTATTVETTSFPSTLTRLKGRAECVTAKRLVKEPISPAASEEAIEIVPGVTFLLTRADKQNDVLTVNYEVRIKRTLPNTTPGLEPVFAGLIVRSTTGQVVQSIQYGTEVETRDEYIFVVKDASLSLSYLNEGATLEADVFDGIERTSFDFEVDNLTLSTPAK